MPRPANLADDVRADQLLRYYGNRVEGMVSRPRQKRFRRLYDEHQQPAPWRIFDAWDVKDHRPTASEAREEIEAAVADARLVDDGDADDTDAGEDVRPAVDDRVSLGRFDPVADRGRNAGQIAAVKAKDICLDRGLDDTLCVLRVLDGGTQKALAKVVECWLSLHGEDAHPRPRSGEKPDWDQMLRTISGDSDSLRDKLPV